jgi:hypothetical protein
LLAPGPASETLPEIMPEIARDRLNRMERVYPEQQPANFGVSGRRFRFEPAGGFGGNRQAISVQSGTLLRGVSGPALANRRCVTQPNLL